MCDHYLSVVLLIMLYKVVKILSMDQIQLYDNPYKIFWSLLSLALFIMLYTVVLLTACVWPFK